MTTRWTPIMRLRRGTATPNSTHNRTFGRSEPIPCASILVPDEVGSYIVSLEEQDVKDKAESSRNQTGNCYEIRLAGHLDTAWSDWLSGLEIVHGNSPDGRPVTVLRGHLRDQAGLHGVLEKLRDLNQVILSLTRFPDEYIGVAKGVENG